MTAHTREEHDSLGPVAVPAGALYGAQTVRAVANFGTAGPRLGDRPLLVAMLARVKIAAARANAELGVLDPGIADAIALAGREVAAGRHPDAFPVALVQGGGGTSANMNANEVLANRAGELLGAPLGSYARVHPNDHVNRSQSTNDVFPTALQLAVHVDGAATVAALAHASDTLVALAERTRGTERIGRTCLQDALPVDTGAVHAVQAAALARACEDLQRALDPLLRVPLGGTAVGTGHGAPAGYRERAVALLAEETGLPVEPAADPLDALQHFDAYAAVGHALVRAFHLLGKLAADLRFLASSPVGEARLPAVQPGSSQMPGKVNPVLPELVLQRAYDVRGAATAVDAAVAAGELELNVMEPVIARRLLEALEESAETIRLFADRCLAGLAWDEDAVARGLAGSRAALVELAGAEGYEAAARAAKS